ncbi:hypothetical protein TanjilG_02157 [Lupinus angustifolius]|uniref:CRM domain-containing protein n=1 Tax=Lupinus angustifolius TaxID=3871 RepID=A0A1J7HGJ9_LUPAN|nr:hypothetical protein TanjilG_02157 [Lupinus angustifolius]
MALTISNAKLSEFSFLNSNSSSFSLSHFPRSSTLFLSHSNFPFPTLIFSSLRTTQHKNTPNSNPNPTHNPSSSKPNISAPWLPKTPSSDNSPKRVADSTTKDSFSNAAEKGHFQSSDKGQNAVERIVLRLRNLGLTPEDEKEAEAEGEAEGTEANVNDAVPVTGEERLGELLKREWVRPDSVLLLDEDKVNGELVLPWEREEYEVVDKKEKEKGEEGENEFRKRRAKAPSLAELTLEDELLRRLRREGMTIRERINVPKAGLTEDVMDKIHKTWRREELVRLKFHEELARDMKTAHKIVERRTGGLVTWSSGSVMNVYRGINYQGPASESQLNEREGDGFFVPDVSLGSLSRTKDSNETSTLEKTEPVVKDQEKSENMTEEEAEYNALLDGLGPRFVEWWGTGILPVDADKLPPTVPGYKTPFRLLPAQCIATNIKYRGEIHIQITRKVAEIQRRNTIDEELSLSKLHGIPNQIKQIMIKCRTMIEDENLEGLSTALSELETLVDTQRGYIVQLETEELLLLRKIKELGLEIISSSPSSSRGSSYDSGN